MKKVERYCLLHNFISTFNFYGYLLDFCNRTLNPYDIPLARRMYERSEDIGPVTVHLKHYRDIKVGR